ncbi:hypothetical protein B7494_g7212 [Chlorociboria aeruginascens]|nr:hypothetical protein B7494_g7212 [Chlorociboria aeruginascens]
MVVEATSPEAHNSEDISRFAAKPDSYDRLSAFQISKFFKQQESTTKDECNRVAADILKSPVSPTPIQGAASYTVAADSEQVPKVIQFRSLKLNIELVEYARQTYKDFVPDCEYEGMFGNVHMYRWDLVPGPAFCRVRHQFLTLGFQQRLRQTVQDFARFSALAWTNKPALKQPSGLLEEYCRVLDRISHGLPAHILEKLNETRQGLPLLFQPEYPSAVQHDDFLENNFHVNEATGHITGVVDWADAIIAPFGLSLGGLETILGVQTSSSWHFHPNHVELRDYFWDTFYEHTGLISAESRRSIEVARLFGLFRTHGFDEGDARIAYLEALCML